MPYKRTIKVSEEVYEKLWELTRKHNLESPNQLLEKLLFEGVTLLEAGGVTPSKTHRVTPSKVEVHKRDYFWWTIKVGEGWDAVETDLNNIQLRKLCQAKLLAQEVCEKINLSKL
jgi:predicted CopG family antitoxin